MLREKLNETLKEAMKSKKMATVATIRLVNAAIKDRDIAARGKEDGKELDENGIMQLLQSMIKQRKESISFYEKGNRKDLADAEAEEIEILQSFLPKALEEQEVDAAISKVISEIEASGIKDMGKVMAELREKFAGQMDFSKVSLLVKQKLNEN